MIHCLLIVALALAVVWQGSSETDHEQADILTLLTDSPDAELKNFDAKAYAMLYPDLKGIESELAALQHYMDFGLKEGRVGPKVVPEGPGYLETKFKLTKFIKEMDIRSIPMEERSLLIVHVDKANSAQSSSEVIANNLRIFQAAISADHGVFYLFNIIEADNYLQRHLNTSFPHTSACVWNASPSDIYTHMRTVKLLRSILRRKFGSVFFMNSLARGPLVQRAAGQWMAPFRSLLFHEKVGIVGPVMSCTPTPHIQTFFFGIRTSLLLVLGKEFSKRGLTTRRLPQEDIAMSKIIQKAGYKMSSLLYAKRLGDDYFKKKCLPPMNISNERIRDPSRWCDVREEEVIFMKWGGDMFGNGMLCDATKQRMQHALLGMEKEVVGLEVPENLRGGSQTDLFKQYEQEVHRDLIIKPAEHLAEGNKVCLLVRVKKPNDPKAEEEEFGFKHLIASLLRQTDANWEAFFVISDDEHFTSRLKAILSIHEDPRLSFMHINRVYRKPYTAEDPGYSATDAGLRKLLYRKDCQWITVTDVGNIYGTEVIKRVRTVGAEHNMVMVPINSRKVLHNDDKGRGLVQWDQMCLALESQLEISLLAYTAQPRPVVGRMELSGVFYDRAKLAAENLFFNNFTHSWSRKCIGCQGEYFTEYIATSRQWSYLRLPIDGMQSIVFISPSPLWCVAAGMVWLSHPNEKKSKCFAQRAVDSMRRIDKQRSNATRMYGWSHFDKTDRVCLRLSRNQFSNAVLDA